MKAIKFSTLFLLSFWLVTSCSKEEVTETNQNLVSSPTIKIDDDRIIFDTYKDYENHINEYQTSEEPQKFIANFKSIYKLSQSQAENSLPEELQDEFLMSILNDNDVVQIGEYLYKVNLISEKVFVLKTDLITDYNDLVSENVSNSNIVEYNTGEDVIDLVEGLADNTSRSCGGIGGGMYLFPETPLGNVNGVDVTMGGGVKFFRAGIYFSLSGTVLYRPKSPLLDNNVQVALHMKSPGCWYKKKPCRNSDVTVRNPGYIIKWGVGNDKQYRLYSGMRNLNGYYLFVRGRGTLIDDYGNWYNTQNASAYGGRNISSPW